MKLKALMNKLQQEGIDGTYIEQYCQNYVPEHPSEPSLKERFKFIDFIRLYGLLKMCKPFRPYFSNEEYSKVVCKSIISYSKLHAGCLSATSEHEELNITTLATPCAPLPKFLITTVNDSGTAKIMKNYGGDIVPIP